MKKLFLVSSTIVLLCLLTGCAGALHSAAAKGDVKAVKEMLDRGANINDVSIAADTWGTPLHFASKDCRVGTVAFLLERGVNVNIAAGHVQWTALRFAADNGCNEVVVLLLDRGAEIDARDRSGMTPLMSAAVKGQSSTVRLLIERGAAADYAIGRLTSRSDKTAAHLVDTAVKSVQEGKAQIVSGREMRPVLIQSDIDQPPAGMSEPRNNAYAVVVGIENYRNIPKSDYSRNDATLVKAYLKALGFQERNIDLITDEKATKTDIEKSLEAWLPNRVKKDATVIIYFSGHGAPDPVTSEAYLVPYDGDPNYLTVTGYPLKRLYDHLGKLDAKEIIVVLDSCFSGSGGRSVLAKGARPLVMMAPMGTLPSNIAILSATQGSQISTSSAQKRHGVFTYYFLKAIKDGKMNLVEIYEHIAPQVEDEAKQLNVQQSPSISPNEETIKNRFSLRK